MKSVQVKVWYPEIQQFSNSQCQQVAACAFSLRLKARLKFEQDHASTGMERGRISPQFTFSSDWRFGTVMASCC
jgi:hypothetical protein